MLRLLILVLVLGNVAVFSLVAYQQFVNSRPALIAPRLMGPGRSAAVLATTNLKRQVIGFLPYWNLQEASSIPFDHLTTIHYFGLDVDGEGNFNRDDGGWAKMKSADFRTYQARLEKNANVRSGLTIVSLDADRIARVLTNQTRQDRLIKNTLAVMQSEGFVDVNIDLEYAGDLSGQLINSHTKFVKRLTETVHKAYPDAVVSLDVYANSATRQRIYDIPELAKIVDQIIIMGYDFHRLGSLKAGPIAPLFGKEQYEYEIYQSVTDHLKSVPPEKLVLAVPFYGYEWPTEDTNPGSFVIGSIRGPEISSYKRSQKTATENGAIINFDELSKSAWFSYFDEDSRTFRQVWFENERSLGLKFDLVNQANLAGIGIWALGYDGADSDFLWRTIEEKLR